MDGVVMWICGSWLCLSIGFGDEIEGLFVSAFFAVSSLLMFFDDRLHCMVNKSMDRQWITSCFM